MQISKRSDQHGAEPNGPARAKAGLPSRSGGLVRFAPTPGSRSLGLADGQDATAATLCDALHALERDLMLAAHQAQLARLQIKG